RRPQGAQALMPTGRSSGPTRPHDPPAPAPLAFADDAARAAARRHSPAAPVPLRDNVAPVTLVARMELSGPGGYGPAHSAACFQPGACTLGLAFTLSSLSSARSRALLRKIWSLPGRYCGGQAISAPYQ